MFCFQWIELLSYIGGYMSIWLGISVIVLVDVAEILFEGVWYAIKTQCMRRKQVEDVAHLDEQAETVSLTELYDI